LAESTNIAKASENPLLAELDGQPVPFISAYLVSSGGHEDPSRLLSNGQIAFGGAKIYGQGFILTPEQRLRLIGKNARNSERIFPYIGGEEVNDNPTHQFYRYVINFGSMTLPEAQRWPDLLQVVEETVKPERDAHTTNSIALRQKEYWWRYRSDTPRLFDAIGTLQRVFAISYHTECNAFALLSSQSIFSHALIVLASDNMGLFCNVQSRVHDLWSRFFGSSIGDTLRYTPSDCFETFPFPENFETDAKLEAVGKEYYEYRAALMVRNNEGLTKTYNRFHDPHETAADIQKLRELHAAMDRAVLDAYGWTALQPTCSFLLDYEEEEDEETVRQRKKPWRYRWPDEFRDEVLARLLELNKRRAEQEALAGAAANQKKPGRRKNKVKEEGKDMF